MEAHLLFVDCKSGYRAVRGQVAIISWCATEPWFYPELVEKQAVVAFAGPGRDRSLSLNSICLQQPLRAGPTRGFYVTSTCQSHYAFFSHFSRQLFSEKTSEDLPTSTSEILEPTRA